MIYDPARHERLSDTEWSPDAVATAIDRIAADLVEARAADGSWPTHPHDFPTADPKWALYSGAAGVVVALRILHRAGYAVKDLSASLPEIHAAYLRKPDVRYETGLQLGEVGILTPAVLADPGDAKLADRLRDCMTRTLGHAAREITSGETGMMHAALSLFRETSDERWKALYLRGAHSLWAAWEQRESGEWLWASDIFGFVRGYYGACHGVAGNVQVFVRGADTLPAGSLPAGWVDEAIARATDTLERAALRDGAAANWAVSGDPSGTRRLVQWCHGAPGVVAALASAPRSDTTVSARLDRLLEDAGEFVWSAGPLVKGPGVCHGTAGNGYAFLGLFHRTGDRRWLTRARRFAMHATEQWAAARRKYGRGHYTLWTGDGGLAVYLDHCLHPERAAIPGLEIF